MSVNNAMLASAAAMLVFGIAFAQQPVAPDSNAAPKPAPQTQAAEPKPAPQTQAAEPKPAPQTQAAEPKPAPQTQAAEPKPAPQTQAAEPQPAPQTKAAGPAATKTATASVERVCLADAAKFCKDVLPGGGRVFKCLTGHEAELAPACRERLASGKARLDEFVKACKSDAETHCKEIPAGSGFAMLSCLKGSEAKLAPDCKAQFNRTSHNATVAQ